MRILWLCNIMLPVIAESLGLPCSNKEGWLSGLAAAFSDGAQKKTVAVVMIGYLLICSGALIFLNPLPGVVCLAVGIFIYGYYCRMAQNKFGGVTGDLAGWFLQVSELCMLLALAAAAILGGGPWS